MECIFIPALKLIRFVRIILYRMIFRALKPNWRRARGGAFDFSGSIHLPPVLPKKKTRLNETVICFRWLKGSKMWICLSLQQAISTMWHGRDLRSYFAKPVGWLMPVSVGKFYHPFIPNTGFSECRSTCFFTVQISWSINFSVILT